MNVTEIAKKIMSLYGLNGGHSLTIRDVCMDFDFFLLFLCLATSSETTKTQRSPCGVDC